MRTIVKNYLKVLLILLLWVPPLSVLALGISEIQRGDNVILIKPMSDGVTYYVQTPNGLEVWKDRDLYYFAGYQESCTVLKSYGSEVLLYVPIMNAQYWFTVEQTNVPTQ